VKGKIHPVVLCGGSGSRLWPMSRRLLPKQFLPLVSERSMLQDTVVRLASLPDCGPPIVVSNNEHRFLVAEQLKELDIQPAVQVLEPVGRNTAPAVAVSALYVAKEDPEGLLLVVPSDSAIRDLAAFQKAVASAVHAARQGFLLTFGIRPTHPATGYALCRNGIVPASSVMQQKYRCGPTVLSGPRAWEHPLVRIRCLPI